MATAKNAKKTGLDKKDVLAELFSKREDNIQKAASWPLWEIEDELERAKFAKKGFLMKDPMHDLRIIDEHINQLEESLKIKIKQESNP